MTASCVGCSQERDGLRASNDEEGVELSVSADKVTLDARMLTAALEAEVTCALCLRALGDGTERARIAGGTVSGEWSGPASICS